MTFKRLKEFVKSVEELGLPDDTPVCIERVEDSYFDGKKGWDTFDHIDVIMPGHFVVDIDANGTPTGLPGQDVFGAPQKFFQAWGAGLSKDGKEILIHAHY